MTSGESARITGLPDSPGAIAWSPDGRRIAYTMFVPDEGPKLGKAPDKPEGAKWADPLQVIDAVTYRTDDDGYLKPGYYQIFWVPSDGGAPTQLTFGATHAGGRVSWTPDGRSILFSADLSKNWEREPLESEIYRVSIDGGAPVALTNRVGPDNAPTVSPDGRHIAFVGFDDRKLGYQNTQLSIMNLDGSDKRVLTGSLDRSVGDPVWSADGRAVYVLVEDRGTNKVERVGLDGSVREVASGITGAGLDRPYAGGEFSVARNGTVAVTAGDPLHPSDIGIASAGGVRRLTHLNEQLGAKAMAQVAEAAGQLQLRQAPDRRVDGHSARLRSGQALSDDPRDPRRPVRRLRPAILDRRPALRVGRLRGALHQPARLDFVRRGVRQPDRQGLSGPRLRRPDERGRRRDRHRPCRPQQPVRDRRLGRRRADRLDRRARPTGSARRRRRSR